MNESKAERKESDESNDNCGDEDVLKIRRGSFIDSLTSNTSDSNTLVVVYGGEAALQSMIKEAQKKVPDVHILYGRDVAATLLKLRDVRRFYFSQERNSTASTSSTVSTTTGVGADGEFGSFDDNVEEIKKLGQVAVSGSVGPGRWLACLPYFLNGPYSLQHDRYPPHALSDEAGCTKWKTMIRTFDPVMRATCFSTIFAPPFPLLKVSTKPGLIEFYTHYGGFAQNFDNFIQICNSVLDPATSTSANNVEGSVNRALEWRNQDSRNPVRWLSLPQSSTKVETETKDKDKDKDKDKVKVKYDPRLDKKLRIAAEEFIYSLYPPSHPLQRSEKKKKKKLDLFDMLVKYDEHGFPIPFE